VIRITRTGARARGLSVSVGNERELGALRAEFDRQHHVQIPGFIDRELAEFLAGEIERSRFYEKIHGELRVELCMERNGALGLLFLAVNDPELFGAVERVTGCDPVGSFFGRVYRLDPSADHHDSWHDDRVDTRMVAMSINLGPPYEGGKLELRQKGSAELVAEVANTGLGDAVLFRIAKGLEHRNTGVVGTAPKIAFAGWFYGRPVSPFLGTRRPELAAANVD
jgi:2OG-Fe(II) oxygenase superfamily